MPVCESISKFAARVGLPERLIRAMVKQGLLPHVKTGKCHVRIHVEAATETIKQYSQYTAECIAKTLPVPITLMQERPVVGQKHQGRPPGIKRRSS